MNYILCISSILIVKWLPTVYGIHTSSPSTLLAYTHVRSILEFIDYNMCMYMYGFVPYGMYLL